MTGPRSNTLERRERVLNAVALSARTLTEREIGAIVGVKSSRSIQSYIDALVRRGELTHERGKTRTLHIPACDGHPWRPLTPAIDGEQRQAIVAVIAHEGES